MPVIIRQAMALDEQVHTQVCTSDNRYTEYQTLPPPSKGGRSPWLRGAVSRPVSEASRRLLGRSIKRTGARLTEISREPISSLYKSEERGMAILPGAIAWRETMSLIDLAVSFEIEERLRVKGTDNQGVKRESQRGQTIKE